MTTGDHGTVATGEHGTVTSSGSVSFKHRLCRGERLGTAHRPGSLPGHQQLSHTQAGSENDEGSRRWKYKRRNCGPQQPFKETNFYSWSTAAQPHQAASSEQASKERKLDSL